MIQIPQNKVELRLYLDEFEMDLPIKNLEISPSPSSNSNPIPKKFGLNTNFLVNINFQWDFDATEIKGIPFNESIRGNIVIYDIKNNFYLFYHALYHIHHNKFIAMAFQTKEQFPNFTKFMRDVNIKYLLDE